MVKSEPRSNLIWWVISVIFILQAVSGLVIFRSFVTWSDRANFGDMFGFTSSLFSGLALAGIIYAILLQRAELRLQRKELQMTRLELGEIGDRAAGKAAAILRNQLELSLNTRITENQRCWSETRPFLTVRTVSDTIDGPELTIRNHGARVYQLDLKSKTPNVSVRPIDNMEVLQRGEDLRILAVATVALKDKLAGLLTTRDLKKTAVLFFRPVFLGH